MADPRFDWHIEEQYPDLPTFLKTLDEETMALLTEKFGESLDDGDTTLHDILDVYVRYKEKDLPKGEGYIYHIHDIESDEFFSILWVGYKGE